VDLRWEQVDLRRVKLEWGDEQKTKPQT
jgi:hypothetical protein